MNALESLRARLGVERVRTDDESRAAYARDLTENPEHAPDAIVMVRELDELRDVVRLAAGARVPLVPRVAGTNLGGLAIPSRGGWIVDLTEMNGIVGVDLDDRVAVLEPGVTFVQLRRRLDELEPRLTIGYPLSPPDASVVANCLLDGLGNLSLRHGAMGEWVSGLEAIRADGTLLRTGAWAAGVPIPFARAPLPDLTGLFLSWHGTTGIVTKLAVQLWPVQPFRERSFVLAYDRAATLRAMRELPSLDVLDDLGGLSWPITKLLFGVAHPRARDPDEPEFFFYLDLSAATRALFEAKRSAVREFIQRLRRDGLRVEDPIDVPTLVRLEPKLERLAEFPTRLDFLLDHPDGGLTWVGTYGPLGRFEAACAEGIAVVERHGFPPTIVARPMKGGHFAVLRFIQIFRRDDPNDRARVGRCNAELCDVLHRHGFVMYKTPAWAIERYRPHLDPGFARLMREVREVLDPDQIMNPGRWQI
jgi:FAD/FMN-containing dehydrogenase